MIFGVSMAGLEKSPKTQLTIEIPEQLAEELNAYLGKNPEDNMTRIIKEALRVRTVAKDPAKFLELAGIVKDAPGGAGEHAEGFLDSLS